MISKALQLAGYYGYLIKRYIKAGPLREYSRGRQQALREVIPELSTGSKPTDLPTSPLAERVRLMVKEVV